MSTMDFYGGKMPLDLPQKNTNLSQLLFLPLVRMNINTVNTAALIIKLSVIL
jgi:hypothetical protein